MGEDLRSFDARFLAGLHHVDDVRNDGDGGEDNHYWDKNSKGGAKRNTPEFVVADTCGLSFFKKKELVFRIEITMVVRAGEDGNCVGDGVIFDGRHRLLTVGADRCLVGQTGRFRDDGVDVLGSVDREEVGQGGSEEMTTTVETFLDTGRLAIGGVGLNGVHV